MSKIRYMTKSWAACKVKEPGASIEIMQRDKCLRAMVRKTQILFCKVMTQFNGNPVGVEFRRKSTDSWGFIVENMDGGGVWRIQYFDRDGFIGHGYRDSVACCMEELITDGYRRLDENALDKISQTSRWQKGLVRSAIKQKLDVGLISFMEMCTQLKALEEIQS
jgi:hypothetical protein